jgi:hypothetical protein
MSLLLQDAVATSMALGALVLLVHRMAAVVRPSSQPPACAACPSACAPQGDRPSSGADTIVPIDALRLTRRARRDGPRKNTEGTEQRRGQTRRAH